MNKQSKNKIFKQRCACDECKRSATTYLCIGGSKKAKHRFTRSEYIVLRIDMCGDVCIPVCTAHEKILKLYFSRIIEKR